MAMRLPGNGRIISSVPIRAGICVRNSIVYFCAGLFPKEGTYICAVNLKDGKEVYRNKTSSSPQGYMLLSGSRLLIPTGRTPYIGINASTGEGSVRKFGKSESWGLNLVGGSYAVAAEDSIITGPSEDGHIHLFDHINRKKSFRTPGLQLIITGDILYLLQQTHVKAIYRNKNIRIGKYIEKWSFPIENGKTILLAGNTLFVGGKNFITAIEGSTGKIKWKEKISGIAESLSYNGRALYESLDTGAILCFSKTDAKKKIIKPVIIKKNASAFADSLSKKVLQLLPSLKGYALICSFPESMEIALKIALDSKLKLIYLEKDPGSALKANKYFQEAGAAGRISVQNHVGRDSELFYKKYFANLIITHSSSIPMSKLFKHLKPCTGVGIVIGKDNLKIKKQIKNYKKEKINGRSEDVTSFSRLP